jgi:hypothetical protein
MTTAMLMMKFVCYGGCFLFFVETAENDVQQQKMTYSSRAREIARIFARIIFSGSRARLKQHKQPNRTSSQQNVKALPLRSSTCFPCHHY